MIRSIEFYLGISREMKALKCSEMYIGVDDMEELITRLRQAEKLNAELKDRISHIGLDVGIATTGQVHSEHPIKSRLEMVANLAKDAARYRFMRDSGKFKETGVEFDAAVDKAIEILGGIE